MATFKITKISLINLPERTGKFTICNAFIQCHASKVIPIAALTQSTENELKILQHSATFFPAFRPLDHGAALKLERKMLHLNIAFYRYASIPGTEMH